MQHEGIGLLMSKWTRRAKHHNEFDPGRWFSMLHTCDVHVQVDTCTSSDKLIFPHGSNRIQMVLSSKRFRSWQTLLIHSHSLSLSKIRSECAKEMFSNTRIPTLLDISDIYEFPPSPSQGPGTIGGRFENVGVENTEEHRSGLWMAMANMVPKHSECQVHGIGHGIGFKMVWAWNYPPSILICGATLFVGFGYVLHPNQEPSFTVGGSIVATMYSPDIYHWLKSLQNMEDHGRIMEKSWILARNLGTNRGSLILPSKCRWPDRRIGINPSSTISRRIYRQMLYETPGINNYLSAAWRCVLI